MLRKVLVCTTKTKKDTGANQDEQREEIYHDERKDERRGNERRYERHMLEAEDMIKERRFTTFEKNPDIFRSSAFSKDFLFFFSQCGI